jgi:hypothetical protein
VLDRTSGGSARRLIVQEEAPANAPREDHTHRVGCLGIFEDDDGCTWIDADVEESTLELLFPDDEFEGMPPSLSLQFPRRPAVGQTWKLLREDGATLAMYLVRAIDIVPGELFHRWSHGDIIRALYDGDVYDARFIRNEGDELALVHWADGTFSELYRVDILGPGTLPWTLELVPADTEVDWTGRG